MKKNIYIKLFILSLSIFSQSLIAANKYWVGNSGNWSESAHWSISSGGTGGAGMPTSTDVAIFDQNSFNSTSQKVIISENISIGGMNWQKVLNSPSLEGTSSSKITSYGSIFLNESMTNNFKGQLEFIFGDYPQSSNFAGHDFTGYVNYSYQPKNLLVQKIEKNHQTSTLAVTVSVSVTDETCPGNCDGAAIVSVLGSAGPFTYSYFPIGPYVGEPTNSISGLCAKSYTVVVKDLSTNTNYPKNFSISSNPPITIIPQSTVDNTCYQSCDGQINLLTFGGSGSLHYTWSDGQTTESATNLCAGIYTLNIIDDAGCTSIHKDTIIEPALLTGTITSQTDLLCNGVCTGAATISASGGTAGYSYSWYDAGGGITNSISNKCAGTYHLKITDSHACKDTVAVILIEPPVISLSASTTQNLLCAGQCIGQVTRTGSGGTAPLIYSWYDAPGTPGTVAVSNLCAGTYHVAVVDGNGCKDTAQTTITTPSALISNIVSSTDVLCRGLCTGDATVRASGGTGPYTYFWYNLAGMTDTTATGICAGASNVQVTDANGCKDTSTVNISEPATTLFGNIVDQTNNQCSYSCSGDATVRVSGGIAPYTYSWYDAPGLETDTFASNLCTQDYNVKITDGNGCTDTITATILSPAELIASVIDSIPLNCTGSCIGSLTVDGSGGTGAYSFNWLNPAGQTTNIVSNLCAGTYDAEISDANGCKDTASYALLVPPGVIASIASQTNNLCFGNCNGSATASSIGGTVPISYSWYDAAGQTTANISSLCNGTYHVAIVDGTGCKDTASLTITSPSILVGTTTDTTVTCLGICDGSSLASASGGVGPYSYNWYQTNHSGPYRSALCAGSIPVKITDANGCKDTAWTNLVPPTVVVASIDSATSTTCFSVCDGTAIVTAAGGTSPYIYDWTTAGHQSDTLAINLCAATHSVKVTDANGCIGNASITITQPTKVQGLIVDSNNVTCKGLLNGDATAGGIGGTGPYTFIWIDVLGNPTTAFVSGLSAGVYRVIVTDNNGCFDTTSVHINEPTSLVAVITATNASCNGICNGSLDASASTGGTLPYSYVWYDAGNQTSPNISGLCIGTNHVEVTDANGCIDTAAATITQPAVLVASIIDSNQATCAGICNGDATADAIGGTAPYHYNWFTAGNQTTALATGLCFGFNKVEVTDTNGCADTVQVQITAPVVVIASMKDSLAVSCFGICDGNATVEAAGGTTPYSYNWFTAGNQTDSLGINLCAGINKVEVSDANGCVDTASVFIDSPTQIVATSTITLPTCNGDCDGTISLSTIGGIPGYTHKWSNGSTISAIINLCAGSYTDTITDATGCADTATFIVGQPSTIMANVSAKRMSCFGIADGEVYSIPTGGTGSYTFLWDDISLTTNDTVKNLSSGLYTVIVSDSLGCKDTASTAIVEPSKMVLNITDTNFAACICNGSATVGVSGGTIPYSYQWNDINAHTTAIANNLCAGNYQVTVVDSSFCRDSISVAILDTSNTFIAITVDSAAVSCFTSCDGYAIVRAVNGLSPYSYLWNDPGNQTDSTATGLCAGTYIAQITDQNGCIRIAHATIDGPPQIIGTITKVDPACNNDFNGLITITPSGGDGGPYTHSWSTLSNNDSITNLGAGTYSDTIRDASGCQNIFTVTLIEPALLTGTTTSTNIACFGSTTGTVSINVSGGTTPYSYTWDNTLADTTASVTGLYADTFHVTVTDNHGCVYTDSTIVSQPNKLVSFVSDSANVYCSCLGHSTLTVNGGIYPYIYQWNDPSNQTDSTAINLCAGVYKATITDANGCITTTFGHVVDTSGYAVTLNNIKNPTCPGSCDGTANLHAVGGTTPYYFEWRTTPVYQIDSTAKNLCPGSYTAWVQDAKGCNFFTSVDIADPDPLIISTINQNISCQGLCDGQITAIASGGTGTQSSFTYSWDDALHQTTDTADSLCAGVNYTVTVTDSAGCTITATQKVTEPTKLFSFISSYSDVQCTGICNGSINSIGVGGTAPYKYLWNNSDTTKSITGLCADSFSVIITDAHNCSDTISQKIIEPLTALSSFIVDSTSIFCNNVCDGIATVRAEGGSPGYNYNWYNTGNTNDTIGINLCAGLNYVEVTDSKGCKDTSQVNILAPPGISIVPNNISHVTCFNSCNGSINVSVSGGIAPYSLQWNDPTNSTDSIVNNLCAGTYTVVVTDANGCIDSIQITINQPAAISTIISSQTDVVCQSYCDGSATIRVSGGSKPYAFLWTNAGNQTDSTAINLCVQTYYYQITDSNNCVYNDSVTINNIGLKATITQNNVSCFSLCDGSASISLNGGSLPYSHSWTTGSTINSINALCAGLYQDTVKDGSGCISVVDVTITEPQKLVGSIDSTNISCHGLCDGQMLAKATGGTSPYTFTWFLTNHIGAARTALCAGNYPVKIVDSHGCVDTTDAFIVDPAVLSVSLISKTDATCFGQCDAQAIVLANGGTSPFKYAWNGGQTGASVNSLCAGNDTVIVSDTNNCSAQLIVPISQPSAIQIAFTDTVQILCNTICNGEVRAVGSGGTGAFSYLWNDPAVTTTDLATGLCAGTYKVIVQDAKGCTDSSNYTITTLGALNISINSNNPKCFGDCNGDVTAVPVGGVKPYQSVLWGGPGNAAGKTTLKVANLCQGTYFVTVTDANNCQASTSKQLNNPPLLVPSITDSTNLSCFGVCNGDATVTPVGGTPPFTYAWNDPSAQTTAQATNLCAGKWKVTVVDNNGCTKKDSVSITQPAKLVSNNTTTPAECSNTHDGAIAETASGGTGKLNYSWSGPGGYSSTIEDPFNILPGRYILTLSDSNGCSMLDTADVQALTFINAQAGNDTAICNGKTITIYGKGGVTYLWSSGQTDSTITVNPNVPTTYTLYVTSGACKDTADIFVNVNAQPTASITMDKNIVLENSSTTLHGTGAGIGGTYDWTPPTSLNDPTVQDPIATPSKTTTYLLTVTTAAGCWDTASATLKTAKDISFPNGITPNGDGRNDKWVIDLIEQFPQSQVEIYNRWGQLLFQSPGYVQQWDGTFDGKPLPVGTYYYIIDLGPGLKKYTGPITLMR